MEKHSRVYAEIDLDAISYNMEQMKKRVGEGAKFIAVVKTDGYGHGAVPIACMLDDDPDVWGYATATLEEAVELHRAGIQKPTMVLGCVFPDQYEEMIGDFESCPKVGKNSVFSYQDRYRDGTARISGNRGERRSDRAD